MIIEREFKECAKIKAKVRWSIDASVAKAKTKTLRIMNVNEALTTSRSRLLIDDFFISSYKALSIMKSLLDTYNHLKQNVQTSLFLTFNFFLSLSSSLTSRWRSRFIYFSSNSNFSLLLSLKKDFELLV